MNREKIVSQLIKEGFSEKTLVKFNDNQLKNLAKKILSEQTVVQSTKTVYDSKDPKQVAALNQALKNPTQLKGSIEVKETEVDEENEEAVDNTEEMNEWVKKVIFVVKERINIPSKTTVEPINKAALRPLVSENFPAFSKKMPCINAHNCYAKTCNAGGRF